MDTEVQNGKRGTAGVSLNPEDSHKTHPLSILPQQGIVPYLSAEGIILF